MSKLINLKISFIDKTYVRSIEDVENLTRRILSNYLIYCRESILQLSKVKKQ
jgi:hypothetical protein